MLAVMTRMFEGTGADARPYFLHSLAINLEIVNIISYYDEVKTKQSQTIHLKRFIHTMWWPTKVFILHRDFTLKRRLFPKFTPKELYLTSKQVRLLLECFEENVWEELLVIAIDNLFRFLWFKEAQPTGGELQYS